MCIPLLDAFQFYHEPNSGLREEAMFGRAAEITDFVHRLRLSAGGAFLITGYRGVGKTSFVNEVLFRLKSQYGTANAHTHAPALAPSPEPTIENTILVDVRISLGGETALQQALFLLGRQLYFRLNEIDAAGRPVYEHLHRPVQETLRRICDSTAGSGEMALVNERALEQDLMRIGSTLSKPMMIAPLTPDAPPGTTWKALWKGSGGSGTAAPAPQPTRLKVVFVLDELDKVGDEDEQTEGELTPDAAGVATSAVERFIRRNKSLLTSSGMSFVFVAGRDMSDRWQREVVRGESVYESVFCYDKYLACLWDDGVRIAQGMIDRQAISRRPCVECSRHVGTRLLCVSCRQPLLNPNETRLAAGRFDKYVAFVGRGIPRRILRTVNQAAGFYEGQPVLGFSRDEIRRQRVYAELWTHLNGPAGAEIWNVSGPDPQGLIADRQRLAVLYLIDLVFTQGADPFTVTDLTRWLESLSKRIVLPRKAAEQILRPLLSFLVKGRFLEEVARRQSGGQENETLIQRYRVAPNVFFDLRGMPGVISADIENSVADSLQGFGGYRIEGRLGQGGMATVYRARSLTSGDVVALKVLADPDVNRDEIRRRFSEEAGLLGTLQHPGIVRLVESGDVRGSLYIAMELIDGVTLREFLDERKRLNNKQLLGIAEPLADALAYLHGRNLVRLDIKPSNVMVSRDGGVRLIDFGIAKAADPSNPTVVVGTLGYMSPEHLAGEHGALEKSDVFAFGAMLYEMSTGRRPWSFSSAEDLLARMAFPPPVPSSIDGVDCAPELERLILTCLATDPQNRPASLMEVRERLQALREGSVPTLAVAQAVHQTTLALQDREERAMMATSMNRVAELRPEDLDLQFFALFEEPGAASVAGSAVANRRLGMGEFTAFLTPGAIGPSVQITSGPPHLAKSTEKIRLQRPCTTFGRSGENHLVLDSESVSRFHGQIVIEAFDAWIEDLSSVSGTTIDGKPVLNQVRLTDGCTIRVGEFSMQYIQGAR